MIGDKLSHQFNFMEHIATIHALYGDNHIQKEIAATSDKDNSKSSGTQKTEDQIPFHLLGGENNCQVFTKQISKLFLIFTPSRLSKVLLPVVSPPPKYRA